MIAMIPNRAKGFTLIELMVALVIGLLVTLVVLQAYLGGLGTQRAQTDAARAQESSRIAFDLLAHSLRQAGYKNPKAPGLGFCDSTTERIATINDPATISPTAATLVGSTVTIANNSDAVKVRYFGEGLPVAPFTTDNSIRDCLGNPVAPNVLAEDTFFVAADANNNNEPTLFCYTTNAATRGNVPLVAGVESMQILYGDDNDADGIVNRYIHGGSISAPNNIRSVKLSIIARTPGASAVDRSAQQINHFGADYSSVASGDAGMIFTTPSDGRTRRHTSTTIALRNLCPV
ncbi:MAG TPA: PilW family protein [Azonexus sp.]|nr:PilW family protein [Azonexus sp.]